MDDNHLQDIRIGNQISSEDKTTRKFVQSHVSGEQWTSSAQTGNHHFDNIIYIAMATVLLLGDISTPFLILAVHP